MSLTPAGINDEIGRWIDSEEKVWDGDDGLDEGGDLALLVGVGPRAAHVAEENLRRNI